jgi:hypothetical protein
MVDGTAGMRAIDDRSIPWLRERDMGVMILVVVQCRDFEPARQPANEAADFPGGDEELSLEVAVTPLHRIMAFVGFVSAFC